MSSSLFKRWVSIFLITPCIVLVVLSCGILAGDIISLLYPQVKVVNSIMAHNENLTYLDSASGDVRIDITYFQDPLTNICYALISGSFPDSEITFNGMVVVPCDNLILKGLE